MASEDLTFILLEFVLRVGRKLLCEKESIVGETSAPKVVAGGR